MAAQVGSATLPLLSARRRRAHDASHQILIGQLRNRDWYLLSERRSRWPGRSAGCRPVPNNRVKRHDNQLHRARVLEVRIQSPPAERCYGAGGEDGNFVAYINRWSAAMSQPNDLSRSLVPLVQDSTIIAVVEMSQSSWLVGGVLPGIERQPRKK